MGTVKKKKTQVERRAVSRNGTPLNDPGLIALFGTGDEINVTPDTAMRHAAVFTCVRVIAETVGTIDAHVYEALPNGGKKIAREHPLYNVFSHAPNPEMTAFSFYETITGHLETEGNCYAEKQLTGAGDVVALWPLRPDRMKPVRVDVVDDAGNATRRGELWFKYSARDTVAGAGAYSGDEFNGFYIPADRIVHVPGFGFDGILGYSPIEFAKRSIEMSMASERFGSNFFKNNAAPSGILAVPERLSEPAYKRIKESWKAAHEGVSNAHKTAILDGGISWQKIGIDPEQGQWLESRKYQRAEIAGLYRVPLHMLNDLDRSTLNNIYQQSVDFVRFCLSSRLTRIEQAINKSVFGDDSQYFFGFDVSSLLRGDPKEMADAVVAEMRTGLLSVNEGRAVFGMAPIGPEGDAHLVARDLMPLTMLGQDPNATATASTAARCFEITLDKEASYFAGRIAAEAGKIEKRSDSGKAFEKSADDFSNWVATSSERFLSASIACSTVVGNHVSGKRIAGKIADEMRSALTEMAKCSLPIEWLEKRATDAIKKEFSE